MQLLPKVVRQIHTMSEEIRDLEYGQKLHNDIKPSGLWYSIGSEWQEWCEREMPHWVEDTNIFNIEIDMTDILIIENMVDVENFNKKYRKPVEGLSTIFIDWLKVVEDYKGIEVRNYHALKWGTMLLDLPLWLYSWDVSSGCLFTTSVITKCEKRYQGGKNVSSHDRKL